MINYNVTMQRFNGIDWDVIYPKTTAENIVSGTFDLERIPNINAERITTGLISIERLPEVLLKEPWTGHDAPDSETYRLWFKPLETIQQPQVQVIEEPEVVEPLPLRELPIIEEHVS